MFNPERLKFALAKRGMSNSAFALQAGVSVRQVSNYLNGTTTPDIKQLSSILNFPAEFFHGGELPEISEYAVSFRSKARTPQKLLRQARAHGVTAFLLNDWLEKEFRLKKAELPDYSYLPPEEAAEAVRLDWGLGIQPIGNMIKLLESKGIRVFSLSIETSDVDAFCTWHDSRPFIFLNTQKSGERSRFDAAHELGHLLRDSHNMKHGKEKPNDIEHQANKFAAAFLMPEAALRQYNSIQPTLENLFKLKSVFGVSLIALTRRMHEIGLISEWIYSRVLCPQIARLKYRTNEPYPMDRETSEVLEKALSMLRADNIKLDEIARQLAVDPTLDIKALTFQLVRENLTRYPRLIK